MTLDDLVELYATYSQSIAAGADERKQAQERLTAAAADVFAGAQTLEVPMRSHCWRADLVA